MKMKWAAGCLGVILCLFPACNRVPHNGDADLSYRVAAAPGESWSVEARFSGLLREKPRLRMLSTWGVFPDLGARIESLKVFTDSGEKLPVRRIPDNRFSVWEITQKVTGPIVVQYQVASYGPFESPEATFVTEKEALALGYCLFLVPDEITDYLPVPITVTVKAPWRTWTSWNKQESKHPETVHDLWSGIVVSGDYQEINLKKEGARVTVLTDRSWSSSLGTSVANRLFPVLSGMMELFGGAPRNETLEVLALFRTAPINKTRSFMVGVSEESAFLCLATPDRYRDLTGLTALATHECLHFYLGGALTAEAEPPFQNNPEMIWFFEGLTEYLSYKLMRQAGVLDLQEWERIRHLKAQKIERKALADMRLSDAARMYEWPEVYELIYNKGYFLAEYLDKYMSETCGPGTLEEVLKKLFVEYNFYQTHQHLRQEVILDLMDEQCPGSGEWVRTHIIQNIPLPGGAWVHMEKAAPEGAAYTR